MFVVYISIFIFDMYICIYICIYIYICLLYDNKTLTNKQTNQKKTNNIYVYKFDIYIYIYMYTYTCMNIKTYINNYLLN